jgi:hypothetical protein
MLISLLSKPELLMCDVQQTWKFPFPLASGDANVPAIKNGVANVRCATKTPHGLGELRYVMPGRLKGVRFV